MPCPFGVNIPQNFAIINAVNTKPNSLIDTVSRWLVKKKYKKLIKDRKKIDNNQPDGNASLCTQCGQCVPKCPQSINIPVKLEKVHAVLSKKKKINDIFI